MESDTAVRTTDDIYKDLIKKLKELRKPHFRFFRFGVKRYGREARNKVKELRPLVMEYYHASLKEEKELRNFE